MKCETCIKREATVAYTHIVDDEKKTLFLCQVCADEKNIDVSPASEPKPKEIPILVKKVKEELTNLAGAEDAEGGICSTCGMAYDEFKKAGRLGCAGCYDAFASQLGRSLKRIHGENVHRGKGPITARPVESSQIEVSSIDKLDQLRDELTQAVSEEAFEKAAQLRDLIRTLEKGQER